MDIIDPCIQKPWSISKKYEIYSQDRIEKILSFLNRNCNGNFYMVDYFRQRFTSSSASTIVLNGHPKNFIENKALFYYLQFLNPKEKKWLKKLNEEVHHIFYKYRRSERLNLEFSYELTAETINRKEIIVQNRITPFELDKNGNLWLALCFTSESQFSSWSNKATIVNFATGDKYEFNGKTFIESNDKILTGEEIAILRCLSMGLIEKQISDLLKIPKSSLGRKKQSAFTKLGAKTSAEATFLARNREII